MFFLLFVAHPVLHLPIICIPTPHVMALSLGTLEENKINNNKTCTAKSGQVVLGPIAWLNESLSELFYEVNLPIVQPLGIAALTGYKQITPFIHYSIALHEMP